MSVLVVCIILLAAFGCCSNDFQSNSFAQTITSYEQQSACRKDQLQIQYGNQQICEDEGDENIYPYIKSSFRYSCIDLSYFVNKGKLNLRNPNVTYNRAKPTKLYSIIMMDPDAPSRSNPVAKNWLHWGILNVPGSQLKKTLTGKEIGSYHTFMAYNPPTPPQGSGYHRYHTIILEQSQPIKNYNLKKRNNFFIKDIADDNLIEKARATFVTINNA